MEPVLDFFGRHNEAFVALGVFISAIATVIVAAMSARATHKTRVSELREKWIDQLRSYVAEITEVRNLSSAAVAGDLDAKAFRQEMMRTHILLTKIRLMLNQDDNDQRAVVELIESYIEAEDAAALKLEEEIIQAARRVFKTEWKRVVKGE